MDRKKLKDRSDRTALVFDDVSLTSQQFKDDCNINIIHERYCRTGVPMPTKNVIYGDDLGIRSLSEAKELIDRAHDEFMQIPASIREKFNNDPVAYFDFATNPDNIQSCVDLGIYSADVLPNVAPDIPPVAETVTSIDVTDSVTKDITVPKEL